MLTRQKVDTIETATEKTMADLLSDGFSTTDAEYRIVQEVSALCATIRELRDVLTLARGKVARLAVYDPGCQCADCELARRIEEMLK